MNNFRDWAKTDTIEKISLTKPIIESAMFVLAFYGVILLLCFMSEIKTYFG